MSLETELIEFTKIIPPALDQSRLDLALSALLPEYSRARIQTWIKSGYITVDGRVLQPKDKVRTKQVVNITATITVTTTLQPQPIAIDLVHEDQDIIVINKPAGLVTHPGVGNLDHTLLNALLYHYPELAKLPRGGIIHRLDKDTSGLMVVTRNLTSHHQLVDDLQKRKIKRKYEAIVNGKIISGGTIEAPIGRHAFKRTHMAIKATGKPAITHYRVIQRFSAHTHLKVILDTGRTHQIRVHLTHIGYPIVGDPTYGKINKVSEKIIPVLQQKLENFKRQALHARCLSLSHPTTNKLLRLEVPPPKDIRELLKTLGHYDTIPQ